MEDQRTCAVSNAVRFLSIKCELGKSKQSSYAEKSDLLCVQRFEQTPRPTAVVVVWRREETCWGRCTAHRTQASEPGLAASDLAAKGRGECAKVNLSWYFLFHNVADCCR